MRKAIFVILGAAMLLGGYSVSAMTRQLVDNYYTDDTFTTACGYQDTNCRTVSGWLSDGCRTNWRHHEVYDCETGERTSASCQALDNGQWVDVACGNDTLTIQGRLHIPIGR